MTQTRDVEELTIKIVDESRKDACKLSKRVGSDTKSVVMQFRFQFLIVFVGTHQLFHGDFLRIDNSRHHFYYGHRHMRDVLEVVERVVSANVCEQKRKHDRFEQEMILPFQARNYGRIFSPVQVRKSSD